MDRKLIRSTAMTMMFLLSPFVVGSEVRSVPAVPDRGANSVCPAGYVGLTFDDGPTMATTLEIVAALKTRGARATFFTIGALAQRYPNLVRRSLAADMEIGNHTYDHPFMDEVVAPGPRNELVSTSNILKDLAGSTPHLYRAPYGRTNALVDAEAKALGMTEVLWTYDTYDYAGASTEQIRATARKARDGDIILMHDGYQSTVNAIPGILDDLAARGMCSGRIVRSTLPKQAWVEYKGDDHTFYNATATRW